LAFVEQFEVFFLLFGNSSLKAYSHIEICLIDVDDLRAMEPDVIGVFEQNRIDNILPTRK
jgi:hypothetical protein